MLMSVQSYDFDKTVERKVQCQIINKITELAAGQSIQ